ncbi:MAG: hypothetical protein J6L73_06580 [Muribaculaceae bacterium]|nr:hypothetical protein [Muribaculaceae bacterium]
MDKKQKIVLFSGIGVVIILLGMLVWVIFGGGGSASEDTAGGQTDDAALQAELDSLRMVNDMMQIENLSRSLDSLPNFQETQGLNLQADQQEIVNKYNEARNKIESLLAQLKQEKANTSKEKSKNQEHLARIKELEGQIGELKDYCKELLQRLTDLNVKYEEEVQKNNALTEQNRVLSETVSAANAKNEELTTKVTNAQRLVLTGVSLTAYNKKGKNEKNVTKAKKLGVSFTVTANNAAKPGMKDFYIIIKTPEGQMLPGGGSFSAEGTTLQATARRQVEYANEEVSTSVYWDVNTSLTPGDYTVRVFCDGQCLATRHCTLK